MIIWIASYPKSGNTWVRSLLSTYLYSDNSIFNFNLLNNIPQFPSKRYFEFFMKDFTDIKKQSDYWIAAQERINLFNNQTTLLKTHSVLCTFENNPFTNKSNTKAAIYIVRDPRNVITSILNHYSFKDINEAFDFMTKDRLTIIHSKVVGDNSASYIGTWQQNYKSWRDLKFAPKIIVKYEDLIKDPKETFLSILNFLNTFMDIKIEEKKVISSVNSCKFNILAKKEKEEGFSEALTHKETGEKIKFFNLGENNNWQTLLKPEIEKKIRTIFNIEMKELGYIKNGAGEGN